MSDLNQVILTGRLTRDPEIRFTPGGTGIANLGLATDNSYVKDGNRVENPLFVDATAFGKTAEFIQKHGYKGQRIALTGSLNLEQWDDKQTGQRRTKISVKVQQLNPIDWKPKGEEQQQNPPQAGSSQVPGQPSQGPSDDDDVPW